MCVPVVIDNLDLTGVDPKDPTLRDKATGVPEGSLGTIPKDNPAGGGLTPQVSSGGLTPAITASDTPAPREDLWINAGDWLRGTGNLPAATAVGSPTGGTPAPTDPAATPDTTPTGADTPGGKPSNVDPAVLAAQGPNADLMAAISAQAAGFDSVAKGILAGQQQAADALKSGFLDLSKQQQDALTAADQLRKNTGQAERKPNYSLSMSRNAARARAGGQASTMLSGVGGVPVSSLSLGRASLLGGGA